MNFQAQKSRGKAGVTTLRISCICILDYLITTIQIQFKSKFHTSNQFYLICSFFLCIICYSKSLPAAICSTSSLREVLFNNSWVTLCAMTRQICCESFKHDSILFMYQAVWNGITLMYVNGCQWNHCETYRILFMYVNGITLIKVKCLIWVSLM